MTVNMFFRSKLSGVIYPYNEIMVNNNGVELITEQQAYPERFAPDGALKREPTIKLEVPKVVLEKPEVSPELAAQKGVTFSGKGPKPKAQADIKGLMEKRSCLQSFRGFHHGHVPPLLALRTAIPMRP